MRDNTGILDCEVSMKGRLDAQILIRMVPRSEEVKSLREQRYKGLNGM